MIESYIVLAGRIRKELDGVFDQVREELLAFTSFLEKVGME